MDNRLAALFLHVGSRIQPRGWNHLSSRLPSTVGGGLDRLQGCGVKTGYVV